MTKHKNSEDRKADILTAALDLAAVMGYQNVTRSAVADKLSISPALVNRHFTTMAQLKRDIMRAAVARPCLHVVAQGMALRDPRAMRASAELKERAANSLKA